jgi:hypothetical protein
MRFAELTLRDLFWLMLICCARHWVVVGASARELATVKKRLATRTANPDGGMVSAKFDSGENRNVE